MIKQLFPVVLFVFSFILYSCDDSKSGVYVNEPLILNQNSSYIEDSCGPDIYPCPPYGTRQYQTVKDNAFLPANNAAEAMANESGIIYMHDFYKLKDSGYKLLMITTTTGWCSHCEAQMESLKDVVNSHGSGSSDPKVAFLVVVRETETMDPASLEFASQYSAGHNLDDIVPVTNDGNNIFHAYMTSESYPFNFFVDLSSMQIIAYSSAMDTPEIFAAKLDEILATLK